MCTLNAFGEGTQSITQTNVQDGGIEDSKIGTSITLHEQQSM